MVLTLNDLETKDWADLESEIEFLQDELMDLQQERDDAVENAIKANCDADTALRTAARVKREAKDNAEELNRKLTTKCLALSDIVDEYTKLLNVYAGYSQTKLSTTRLNELRKRGGYPPI